MKNTKKEEEHLRIELALARRRIVELEQSAARFALAEEASKENRDRFRALMMSCSEVLYRMSPDWSEIQRLRGIGFLPDAQRLSSRWLEEYIHPDDRQQIKALIDEAINEKSIFELEHRFMRADGSIGWTFSRAVPMMNARGEIIEWFGIARDITRYKQAQEALKELNTTLEQRVIDRTEALRESEESVRHLIQFAPAPIYEIDFRGPKFRSVNDVMIREFGYSREEFLSMNPFDLLDEEGMKIFQDRIEKTLSGEKVDEMIDYKLIAKDGREIYGALNVKLIYEDGKPIGALVVGHDLTERKLLEEELRKYRDRLEELVRDRTIELEEKNRKLKEEMARREKAEGEARRIEAQLAQAQRIEALDKFAGGIAHDLNNILSPIIVNIETLLEEEPPGSIRHDILEETLKAAYRQRDLIKKILSFGRRNEQVLKPIRIRPLLEETLAFLRSSLPSTITIRQRFEAQSDTIIGDPVQIQQIILNLCQNAADAIEDQKGTIEVKVKNTILKSVHGHKGIKEGEYLKIDVKDDGAGMSPEVVGKIFDPFFTTKSLGKGTGMGLPIAYGIVKSHGGTITVESREGKGSLFKVYLPVSKVKHKALSSKNSGSQPERCKGKILLVDDEEFLLSSLRRALGKAGYEVTSSGSSVEAFSLFTSNPYEFDLVITDMTMPEMTGMELAGKLMKLRPGIPVILCTGFNDAISQEEAKLQGIRQLLLKPVGAGDLKKIIHRILNSDTP